MTENDTTRRQVLDRLVEKLQADADLLADQRRKLDEEIARKRAKLAALDDQIAAAEIQVHEARLSSDRLIAESKRAAESKQEQSESQMRQTLNRNRLAEQSSNDKRDKAVARMTEAVTKAQAAEADFRAKKAMVDGVIEQIQSVQRIVAGWKL